MCYPAFSVTLPNRAQVSHNKCLFIYKTVGCTLTNLFDLCLALRARISRSVRTTLLAQFQTVQQAESLFPSFQLSLTLLML